MSGMPGREAGGGGLAATLYLAVEAPQPRKCAMYLHSHLRFYVCTWYTLCYAYLYYVAHGTGHQVVRALIVQSQSVLGRGIAYTALLMST